MNKVKYIAIVTMIAGLICGCAKSDNSIGISNVDTGKNETNTVMYERLTNTEQSVYDSLLGGFKEFKSTISVYGTEDEVKNAYEALSADRPDIFQVEGYVYDVEVSILDKDSKEANVYPNYICNADEYKKYLIEIDEVMGNWFKVDPNMSDYDKSRVIYEEIAKRDSYNKAATMGRNIISAYLLNDTMCDGYSQAYAYALQKNGIPCITVTGTLDDADHSWNVSKLDGAYYLSDLTNGDASYTNSENRTIRYINYSYFNMNPDHIKSYIADPEFLDIEIGSMEDNYFVKESMYFTNYNPELLGNVIKVAASENKKMLIFSFSSIDVLNEAIEKFFDNGMGQYIDASTINYMTSGKFNTLTLILSEPTESAKIDIKPEVTEPEADSTDIATGVEIVNEPEDTVVIECNTAEPKQESKFSDEDPAAYEYYMMLPADIRRSFENSDWTWYVYEDASLASKYGWGVSIAGMTDWNKHEIAIDRRDESKAAIVHEMGHWSNHFYNGGLQNIFINAVFDEEWANLYNEFGGSRCNYDTVEEFGASAFEYYFLEPERLAAVAPYTYKLMAKFVNGDTTFTNMANNVYTSQPQTVAASTDISRTGTCVNSFGNSVIEVKAEALSDHSGYEAVFVN